MGCSASKQNIQVSMKLILEQQLRKEVQNENNQDLEESIKLEQYEVQIKQVMPSEGEGFEQPDPISPICQGTLAPTFAGQNELQIRSHLKSALAKTTRNILVPDQQKKKRSKTVTFQFYQLKLEKPIKRLRRDINLDDLF